MAMTPRLGFANLWNALQTPGSLACQQFHRRLCECRLNQVGDLQAPGRCQAYSACHFLRACQADSHLLPDTWAPTATTPADACMSLVTSPGTLQRHDPAVTGTMTRTLVSHVRLVDADAAAVHRVWAGGVPLGQQKRAACEGRAREAAAAAGGKHHHLATGSKPEMPDAALLHEMRCCRCLPLPTASSCCIIKQLSPGHVGA
jgi:hypothetical protein